MRQIFISYSHQDKAWKNRVVKQLRVLAHTGLDVWDDRRIAAGDDWHPEIQQAIERCDVAVLLISADFLTSPFILDQEVPQLLQRRQEQGIRVIPLIVRPCEWQRIDWLKTIQARPTDDKKLSGMKKHQWESVLSKLAGEIADLLLAPPPGTLSSPEAEAPSTGQNAPIRTDLTHLPAGAAHFLGRDNELAALDAAWASAGNTALVELIAPGGTGKTALVKRWLEHVKTDNWRGASRVFAWSFYSQGSGDGRNASEDLFLA